MILAGAAVNPDRLTGGDQSDALTSHRPNALVRDTVVCVGHASTPGAFEWELPPWPIADWWPSARTDRRGRELEARRTAPARFTSAPHATTSLQNAKEFWSIRPNGTSAKNWNLDSIEVTALNLNG